jgi:hypothetical protein
MIDLTIHPFNNGEASINNLLKEKNYIIVRFKINYNDNTNLKSLWLILKHDPKCYDSIHHIRMEVDDNCKYIIPQNITYVKSGCVVKDNFYNVQFLSGVAPYYQLFSMRRNIVLYDPDF